MAFIGTNFPWSRHENISFSSTCRSVKNRKKCLQFAFCTWADNLTDDTARSRRFQPHFIFYFISNYALFSSTDRLIQNVICNWSELQCNWWYILGWQLYVFFSFGGYFTSKTRFLRKLCKKPIKVSKTRIAEIRSKGVLMLILFDLINTDTEAMLNTLRITNILYVYVVWLGL